MITINDDDDSAVLINVENGTQPITTTTTLNTNDNYCVDQNDNDRIDVVSSSYNRINDQSQPPPPPTPPPLYLEQGKERKDINEEELNRPNHRSLPSSFMSDRGAYFDYMSEINDKDNSVNNSNANNSKKIKPSHRYVPSSFMSDRDAYFDYMSDINDKDSSVNNRNNRNNSKSSIDPLNKARHDSNADSTTISSSSHHYDWRRYSPRGFRNGIKFIRWLINGESPSSAGHRKQTNEKFLHDLSCLSKYLSLLRQYVDTYGIPKDGSGGIPDQNYVLREISRDLCAGGAPLWALESVMQRASEGLTGDPYVTWNFLPRIAYMYHSGTYLTNRKKNLENYNNLKKTALGHQHKSANDLRLRSNRFKKDQQHRDNAVIPSTTIMFKLERGFTIHRLDAIEPIVVKLASYASNTSGVSLLPYTRFPTSDEFNRTCHQTTTTAITTTNATTVLNQNQQIKNDPLNVNNDHNQKQDPFGNNAESLLIKNNDNFDNTQDELKKESMASEILKLSSETQGIYYYVNSPEYKELIQKDHQYLDNKNKWVVSDDELECFSRLACIDAMKSIDIVDEQLEKYPLYNHCMIISFFRILSCSGSCIIWFNGSWYDMIVAGVIGGVIVAYIGESTRLSKQEKLVCEAVAGYIVGLIAGLIAYYYPDNFCYGAIAVSSMIDLLQGFKVVNAVIEIMSRNTVSGGADFIEGILFTGLISYFLRFGQYTARQFFSITQIAPHINLSSEDGNITSSNNTNVMVDVNNNATSNGTSNSTTEWSSCSIGHGVSERWYILFVPLTALAWSGLFSPNYYDLLPMTFHGVLAFYVNYGLVQAGVSGDINNFVSAMTVAFSAGLFSRFTGRQAVGNTVAGLYVLVPGAYLVSTIDFASTSSTESSSSLHTDTFFLDIIQKAITLGIGSWAGTLLCSPTLLSTTKGLIQHQTDDLQFPPNDPGFKHYQSGTGRKHRKRGGRQPTMLTF